MLFLQKTTLGSLFLFALLVLAAGCGEDDGINDGPVRGLNNSSATVTTDGVEREFIGDGYFFDRDTLLPLGDTIFDYDILYASIAKYVDNDSIEEGLFFVIPNYSGPGTYVSDGIVSAATLLGQIVYSNNAVNSNWTCRYFTDSYEITITRNNGEVLEGSFNGTCDNITEINEVSGSFTIRNP